MPSCTDGNIKFFVNLKNQAQDDKEDDWVINGEEVKNIFDVVDDFWKTIFKCFIVSLLFINGKIVSFMFEKKISKKYQKIFYISYPQKLILQNLLWTSNLQKLIPQN